MKRFLWTALALAVFTLVGGGNISFAHDGPDFRGVPFRGGLDRDRHDDHGRSDAGFGFGFDSRGFGLGFERGGFGFRFEEGFDHGGVRFDEHFGRHPVAPRPWRW